MPPVQFDNRISWMDMIAIAGVAASLMYGYFGYGENIRDNTAEIDHVKRDVQRIESQQREQSKELSRKLDEMRIEQKQDIKQVDHKVDKLIQIQLEATR